MRGNAFVPHGHTVEQRRDRAFTEIAPTLNGRQHLNSSLQSISAAHAMVWVAGSANVARPRGSPHDANTSSSGPLALGCWR
jgi:hypothetical protein